jgi:hypothetical protein
MSASRSPLAAMLPLNRIDRLAQAIGRTLVDVERHLPTRLEDFLARGGDESSYFSLASGATEMIFSDGLVHTLSSWPSQLSLLVSDQPRAADPDAPGCRLSATAAAPAWLKACLGRRVRDVCVYVYQDDVDSDEARQAAVSYVLDSGTELFYGTYFHGNLDADELLEGAAVPRDHVAERISIAALHGVSR